MPFLFEAGRPGGRVHAHTLRLRNAHAGNVHVYVCAQLHNFFFMRLCPKQKKSEWNKCKNPFNEMKGDVGMSLHEKEGNKKNLHQADNPSLHLCS